MNKDCNMIYESYGTMYRGSKTEQDSKDYSMNIAPFMHIIKQLSRGTFDTDSDQDLVSKGELQGIFDVDTVDGRRQVVLTNDAVKKIEQMHPELKGKFWECGKCKADYAGCGAAKREQQDGFRDQMPDSQEEYSAQDYVKDMEMRGEDAEESKHPLGNVREVPARDLKPGDVLSLFKNTVINIDDMAPRLVKGKVRVTYKDIRGVVHNVDWNKGTKITVDNASQEDEEGDLMKHMKDKGMIDAKATDDTGKYGRTREEEEGTEYVVGKTYTITLHNGEKFTGVFKYQKDMDRYDRSTGAYGSSWEQVLSNGTHVVVVGHGRPHHVPEEDEQRRLDPKCWKGYHKSGTKTKSGVRVNNCVKN